MDEIAQMAQVKIKYNFNQISAEEYVNWDISTK